MHTFCLLALSSPPHLHLFLFPGICMLLAYLGLIQAWLAVASVVHSTCSWKCLSHVIQWVNSRDVEGHRDCGTKDSGWVKRSARFSFLCDKRKTNLKSKGILCSTISIGGAMREKAYLKNPEGAVELAHQLPAWATLPENLLQFPAPTWWLLTTCNSRKASASLCGYRLYIHMCRQNPHTHKIEMNHNNF